MEVRRATYDEAKRLKEFDPFVGDRRVDNWRGELLVCADGGAVVGYVAYSSNLFYNRPFVALLCVRDGHRRRGVAAALVRRVLDLYEGLDVWASTEAANGPAVRLFERLGFTRQGRVDGLDGDGSAELFLRRRADRAPAAVAAAAPPRAT
jgi:ribosomal protein S18 acetylase RimI-like enzyme